MFKSISKVLVRFAETDLMGVVHHGNYATYLELARIEWLANIGISYKEVEDQGISLFVYNMETTFLKSAYFGDTLKIESFIKERPRSRMVFYYNIYNQDGELLTKASTTLVFFNNLLKRPIRCPGYIMDKIEEYSF